MPGCLQNRGGNPPAQNENGETNQDIWPIPSALFHTVLSVCRSFQVGNVWLRLCVVDALLVLF